MQPGEVILVVVIQGGWNYSGGQLQRSLVQPRRCLAAIKGFHDEALHGIMKGHSSSRLGLQYRVIYIIEESDSIVLVMNITVHDYRKK